MTKPKPLIAALFFILLASAQTFAQKKSEAVDAPTVAYCDVVHDPASFDGRIVRVRAVYFVGFEGSLFRDKNCDSNPSWVKFDPAFEKATNSKVRKRFRRMADASPVKTRDGGISHPVKSVEVLVVALFEGVKPTYKLGNRNLSTGFGHLNAFDYQFIVLSIEEAKAVTESAP
jgi:hypothetical protein